jgi:hypothetical protein
MSLGEMALLYHMAGLEREKLRIARGEAAGYVRRARFLEASSNEFVTPSTMTRYVQKAKGLGHFFDAVRQTSSSSVMDIGGGTLNGIGEIAASDMAKGLTVRATTLRWKFKRPHSLEKVYRTSAEYMRGIDPNSLGGVLALQSLAFAEQTLTACQLERVCVEGAVLKATGKKHTPYSDRWENQYKEWGYQTLDELATVLREKFGWDIAIHEGEVGDDSQDTILVAVKPGGQHGLTAQEILERDLEEFKDQ